MFLMRKTSLLGMSRRFSVSVLRSEKKDHEMFPSKVQESGVTRKNYAEFRQKELSSIASKYPHKYPVHQTLEEVVSKYESLHAGQSDLDGSLSVAGRIYSVRHAGKHLRFIDVRGGTEGTRMQIKVSGKTYAGDDLCSDIDFLRRGDLIGVAGFPARTKAGELSVEARKVTLLAPCLTILPQNYKEWENVDKRFRLRHVDFLTHPYKRTSVFADRAAILREMRSFLDSEGFLEVETPVLSWRAGGANARPFTTVHHQCGGAEMCMRVAPELFLKTLLVGDFERVYEIGKQFRNEGVDSSHNPEFTTCEFYAKHLDYTDMLSLTSRLIRQIVKTLHGEEMKVPYQVRGKPVILDFKTKYARHDYLTILESAVGKQLPTAEDLNRDTEDCRQFLQELCNINKLPKMPEQESASSCRLLDKLFSKLVEPELLQPTYVLNIPQTLSPLAKPHREKPYVAERFEMFVAGMELVNAYTELNDPDLQRQMLRRNGGGFAQADEDFLSALDCGLAPCAGCGIGLDRLVMLLTGQTSIREVVLFPQLRQIEPQ